MFQYSSQRHAPTTPSERETVEDIPVDTVVSKGAGDGKRLVKTKEMKEHTHTHTPWKVLIHGPCLGRRRRCIDCAQATNEKSIGVSCSWLTWEKRALEVSWVFMSCQGKAELAADTLYPLYGAWPGEVNNLYQPLGHSGFGKLENMLGARNMSCKTFYSRASVYSIL